MERTDEITDQDINGFLDGELTAVQRAELQARLAQDPELACRVMTDMHLSDVLRLSGSGGRQHSTGTIAAALRLERSLARRRFMATLRTSAIAASIFAVGWFSNTLTTSLREPGMAVDATFAETARVAVDAVQTEVSTPGTGRTETMNNKIARLEETAEVVVPAIPADWDVKDVRLQPINGKKSVVVTAEAATAGPVTLVAAPMERDEAVPPTAVEDAEQPAVVWQTGQTGYALVGNAPPSTLHSMAQGIEVASRKNNRPRIRG